MFQPHLSVAAYSYTARVTSQRNQCTPVCVQMKHRNYNQPYSEIDGMMVLQKYAVQNAGNCRVVLHPSCADPNDCRVELAVLVL